MRWADQLSCAHSIVQGADLFAIELGRSVSACA